MVVGRREDVEVIVAISMMVVLEKMTCIMVKLIVTATVVGVVSGVVAGLENGGSKSGGTGKE